MFRKHISLLENKIMFLLGVKNIFASRTQIASETYVSQFSHHERNQLSSFKFCSLKMFPHKTMANRRNVEVEEPQAGYRKGKAKWKDEKIYLLITLYEDRACLWDVAHEVHE